ncbi:MAG: DUF177 domain-containing protein [Mariprofundales bacterium]
MRDQFVIELQDIFTSAWQWNGEISAHLLTDNNYGTVDCVPVAGVARGVLCITPEPLVKSAWQLSGNVKVDIKPNCRRCNITLLQSLEIDIKRDYRLGLSDDDNEIESLPEPCELNLIDVVREELWLHWSYDILCKSDCHGLCPQCGINLNNSKHETCSCTPQDDSHPFAALRNLKQSKTGE